MIKLTTIWKYQYRINLFVTYSMSNPSSMKATIKNIQDFLTYEVFEDGNKKCLTIMWDFENNALDKKMDLEYRPEVGCKSSHLWIKKLIEVSGWSEGNKLYCFIKRNSDGCFHIWHSQNKNEIGPVTDIVIDEMGYVVRLFWQEYNLKECEEDKIHSYVMIRCPSVFNDRNSKQRIKKILSEST